MYLEITDLNSHMRGEDINVISRGDNAIPMAAIDAAISETKGYLAAFDVDVIFAQTGASRNALLLTFVKDIAVWHFINLCNAGSDWEKREKRYNRAVDWLKAVQKGNVSPDLPKAPQTDTSGTTGKGEIIYGSNPKKTQHF